MENNYTKFDLTDKDWTVRMKAYENLGWTKDALKDENKIIRLEAYKQLSLTE